MRLVSCVALILLASTALTQTAKQSKPHALRMVWEPPEWDFPQDVKASVPKEMFAKFGVSGYDIILEETKMEDVVQHLGGQIGKKGDAGDALAWLCFHGADAIGAWVLWLVSSEIDGGNVGSFQWQRVSRGEVLDRRCHTLQGADSRIKLPLFLTLGAKRTDVLKNLGPPTSQDNERLIYLHEHQDTIQGQPYTSSNIVMVRMRNGIVWAIQVSKTTSS